MARASLALPLQHNSPKGAYKMWQAQNHQQKQLLWKRAQGWQMPHLALREAWKTNLKIGTPVVGWGRLVATKQSQRSCKRSRWSHRAPWGSPSAMRLLREPVCWCFPRFLLRVLYKEKCKALNPPPFEFQPMSIKVRFPLLWMLSTEISIQLLCEELT